MDKQLGIEIGEMKSDPEWLKTNNGIRCSRALYSMTGAALRTTGLKTLGAAVFTTSSGNRQVQKIRGLLVVE